MQADCIVIRRSARFIVRRRTFGGLQTNLKPVSCATISFSNGAQNMHPLEPARLPRLKNTAVRIGSGDCPVMPLLCHTVETANEGIDSPNHKSQSPFAFDKPIASTEAIDCSDPRVLMGSRGHRGHWKHNAQWRTVPKATAVCGRLTRAAPGEFSDHAEIQNQWDNRRYRRLSVD
jgi:hypothetical protein